MLMGQSPLPHKSDTMAQAQAFEELVGILQANPDAWWEQTKLSSHLETLYIKAGFDSLLRYTLVKFDEKTNVAVMIVTISANDISFSRDGQITEQSLTLEQAIETIYGINKL
jgi:hypothetical protein